MNVFNTIFFAVALLTGTSVTAQSGNEELLKWNKYRKLTWDDYKAAPDTASGFAASTTTYLNADYVFSQDGFTFKIHSAFSKTNSWGYSKTSYVLKHEQGHFDIAEIFARKLYKELKAYQYNPQTCKQDVSAIYERITGEKAKLQDKYDTETNHSLDKEKQKEWLKKIELMLEEYAPWAGY